MLSGEVRLTTFLDLNYRYDIFYKAVIWCKYTLELDSKSDQFSQRTLSLLGYGVLLHIILCNEQFC